MSGELNLTLPERKKNVGIPKSLYFLVVVIAILGISHIMLLLQVSNKIALPATTPNFSSEQQKELALKLEKASLPEPAAQAWKRYLEHASLEPGERASIYYRVGKLYEESAAYEKAVEHYYYAEATAHVAEISSEISRRVQLCLENLGKFAALRYELSDRVGIGTQQDAGGEVIAEIGPHKFTRAELDKRIEAALEQQLAMYGAVLPPEELKKQKEAAFKQFTSSENRMRLLQQFLAEEILYRQARETKIAEKPEVQAFLRDTERKILAQKVMENECTDKIRIMESDIQTYYQAHQKEYTQPERVKISHIQVKDEQGVSEVRKRLAAGENFSAVAKELSLHEPTKNKGGKIDTWIAKGSDVPYLGHVANADTVLFTTEQGKVASTDIKSEQGLHIVCVDEHEAERQKTFEEVKNEVYRALRSSKEKEVQSALLEELKEKYNVVIHLAKFQPEKSGK